MILKRLSLRGSKGIKYGMGVDGIEVDFTKFQPGLVAIMGRNGIGKTTLLENLTPFRTLFSRKGSLQKHFLLSDSHRILEFQIGNDQYRAEIHIDASRDKTAAALYKNSIEVASSPREYDVLIDKLFLSKNLFEQSLFFGQDTVRISDLRAGEAKEFMAKLLQLDMAQALQKRASLYANEALREYNFKDEQLRGLSDKLVSMEDLNSYLEKLQEEATTFKQKMQLTQNRLDLVRKKLLSVEEIDRLKEVTRTCRTKINKWREKEKERAAQYEGLLKEYSILDLSVKMEEVQRRIAISITQKEFDEYKDLEVSRNALNVKKSSLSEILQKAQAEKSDIAARRLVKSSAAEKNVELIKARIKRAEKTSSVIDVVPCTKAVGESCLLLKDAHEAQNSLKEEAQRLDLEQERLQKILVWREEEFDLLTKRIHKINLEFKQVDQELRAAEEKIHLLGNVEEEWLLKDVQLKHLDEIKNKINTCEEVLTAEEKNFEDFKSLVREEVRKLFDEEKSSQEQIAKLSENIDFEDLKDAEILYTQEIDHYNDLIAQTITKIGGQQQRIKDASKSKAELKALKRSTRITMQNLGDWRIIEKAFGKSGIQAFEIKKALPAIVRTMNELLVGELGQKFSLNFRMKRLGTKGQVIDTFDPLITRYEEDQIVEEEVPLNNLSRGERILIFVAMSEAVGVYLRNSIGLDLKTSFVDEADGPLDPSNRADYLRTRLHIHGLCGLYHTFIISQSPDIYEQIPQKLKLRQGGIEIIV